MANWVLRAIFLIYITIVLGGNCIKALCPCLGEELPQLHDGVCPWHLQNPAGKRLKISFIGVEPYIRYIPRIGGSDFKVIEIMAKKFRFLPIPLPERSFDSVEINGTISGMVFRVRWLIGNCASKYQIKIYLFVVGFFKEKWSRNWTSIYGQLQIWPGQLLALDVCLWIPSVYQ